MTTDNTIIIIKQQTKIFKRHIITHLDHPLYEWLLSITWKTFHPPIIFGSFVYISHAILLLFDKTYVGKSNFLYIWVYCFCMQNDCTVHQNCFFFSDLFHYVYVSGPNKTFSTNKKNTTFRNFNHLSNPWSICCYLNVQYYRSLVGAYPMNFPIYYYKFMWYIY